MTGCTELLNTLVLMAATVLIFLLPFLLTGRVTVPRRKDQPTGKRQHAKCDVCGSTAAEAPNGGNAQRAG